jgi:hypothetical protein
MRTGLPLLEQVHIASPCHAEWNAMHGDDRSRFCGECQKHVYNLSEMTTHEAEELIRAKEGNLCVRYYQRDDGTVLTADCPVGVHHQIRRRRRSRVLATVASMLFMTGCAREEGSETDDFFERIYQKTESGTEPGCGPGPKNPIAGGIAIRMGEPVVMGMMLPPEAVQHEARPAPAPAVPPAPQPE